MKNIFSIVFILHAYYGNAQYAVENYSNARVDQLQNIEQVADWIQFHNLEYVYPLLTESAGTDKAYLNIESSYISKEYARDNIVSNNHTSISDDRNVIWYERNFYKKTNTKLKPRYQVYITMEFIDNSYKIVDLMFGKKKKINTDQYDKN
jgi:hypothetical protein